VLVAHRKIFERYMYVGAITRNPDAIAAVLTKDGVYRAPLVPTAVRCGAWWAAMRSGPEPACITSNRPTYPGTLNLERFAYVLHDTPDPDVLIAEIAVAFDQPVEQPLGAVQSVVENEQHDQLHSLTDT
jgi:uncharacterized protein